MNEETLAAPQPDWLSSQFLLGSVGAPFLIGLAVGYFAKKTLKIALFVGGAIVAALFAAEFAGITSVNDQHLQEVATQASQAVQQSGGYLMERLSNITAKGVSGGVGFLAGLKLG